MSGVRSTQEMDPVSAFSCAWRRLQRASGRTLATIGLTLSELQLLNLLSVDGPAPMTRFAEELFMTPASVTGLVDKLEAEKLVERVRGNEDRRVVTVRITPLGREKVESGLKLKNEFVAAALKTSLSKEEVTQLVGLLAKLADAASSL